MPPDTDLVVRASAAAPSALVDGLGHTRHAPLSAGQSYELANAAKEDSVKLHKSLTDLHRELAQALEAIAALQNEDKRLAAGLAALQGSMAATDKQVQEVQKDVARADAKSRELRESLDKTESRVDKLYDDDKQLQHKLESMLRDSVTVREDIQGVKADLARNFENDRTDRGEFDEVTGRLFRNIDKLKQSFDTLEDKTRCLEIAANKVSDDMDQAGSNIEGLEGKVKDAMERLRLMDMNLDETTNLSKKLRDDHERTKVKVEETRSHGRELHGSHDDLEDRFKKAMAELSHTREKLAGAQETLRTHHERLARAQDEVSAASQGQLSHGSLLRSLQEKLEATQDLAATVKDGLRQTNSVVLPNIMMDTEHSGVLTRDHMHPDLRPPVSPGGGRSRPPRRGIMA